MDPIPISPNLLKRFYEALAILAILGKNRGERTKEEPLQSDQERHGDRRAFLRHLSYLCDYEKGGDTATAIALEETPQGVVYWFASNKNAPEKSQDVTKMFLQHILGRLQQSGATKSVSTEDIETEMFTKCVKFSSKRISEYVKILRSKLDFLLADIDIFEQDQGTVRSFECYNQ